ncbi:hypothetical protein G7Y89_g3870 [Cudoniella acicularis]|uniref:Uncharacterized protein n=1 Tax=Cudoniella acicularis TaxID=354080 RepID=A0A8H4RSN5_9HELO|nr:hypothetical protein G7Y89_g3870 [Cudoniella acicularis]
MMPTSTGETLFDMLNWLPSDDQNLLTKAFLKRGAVAQENANSTAAQSEWVEIWRTAWKQSYWQDAKARLGELQHSPSRPKVVHFMECASLVIMEHQLEIHKSCLKRWQENLVGKEIVTKDYEDYCAILRDFRERGIEIDVSCKRDSKCFENVYEAKSLAWVGKSSVYTSTAEIVFGRGSKTSRKAHYPLRNRESASSASIFKLYKAVILGAAAWTQLEEDPPEHDPADLAACSGTQDTAQLTAVTAQIQRRKRKTLMSTFRCGIAYVIIDINIPCIAPNVLWQKWTGITVYAVRFTGP